jgi:hypothetical protein
MVTSNPALDTVTETGKTALAQLLKRARTEGVRISPDRQRRYFASSVSEPGELHAVNGYSCDCRGFMVHGPCKHLRHDGCQGLTQARSGTLNPDGDHSAPHGWSLLLGT